MMHDEVMVNAADIARLADVGRAAVSNWRKRFDDFPQPVGGSASSPAFSLAEVESWLRRHDRYVEVAPIERLWQRLRASTDDLRLGDAVGFAGTVLLHQRQAPDLNAKTLFKRLSPTVPDGLDVSAELVGAITEVGRAEGSVAAFDGICDRYVSLHSRRLLTTPRGVADLMARIGDTAGRVVLDPACGIGTLLLRSAGARTLGQEVNESAARLAGIRLRLHGHDSCVETGDSLRADAFPGEQADVVVCNPPFNERGWGYEELANDPRWEYGLPPRGESELAWVQHCLAHVRPGGLVVIVMPGVAASRRAGRRVRGNLLRAGALRAIITLSVGATPASSGAPDLWVLRRPEPGAQPPSEVLMVHAGEDLALAEASWQAFRDGRDLPEGSDTVRIIDLLDEEIDLTVGQRISVLDQPGSSSFTALREKAMAMTGSLNSILPRLSAVRGHEPAMSSLGELARAGAVTILQGPLKLPGDGDLPVLTAKDLLLGRAPTGRSADAPGLVRVERDDVVAPVVTGSGSVPRVMTESGAVLGPQLLLIRTDPDRLDPHFLVGCLRAAGGSGIRLGSSMRLDPRRARLPRLPIDEQRRYGVVFRQLLAYEDATRALREISDNLVAAGIDGLFDGSLRPD
ncbi:SAM-dependent methyltransferase [Streptosporangium sp. NBC_01810]|uniref:N-6 DNA methylase n=1 Tax=Streptosporangium sp. NBC_01810 TaxID=2975951 RepID=UPI002DDC5DC1|nr:N-6 DNA methylase [Streptosporangium sp. NBC_01810]WSA25401.1 SAM-dependent methyltransferase [Streptosporangium sp. NBC_01810]